MILKSLRLRGFKGIRSGMGLDEIFIDFSSIPFGLVAITGDNGRGKSTVLDSAQPYRLMPYKCRKSKNWSPDSFSFYDQTFGSDACKELEFEMGGINYRSLILIDAVKRRQECYLYRRDDLESDLTWHTGKVNWVPINDGKSRTYDDAIEAICGSPSLFFNSVFRAQGARNLSDLTRGDILGLISELLNIEKIKEQADKCRTVVTGLTAGMSLARDRAVTLAEETNIATELKIDIEGRCSVIEIDRLGLDAARGDLETVRGEIVTTRETQASQESELARLGMLKAQLADEEKRLADGEAAAGRVVADFDKRIADVVTTRDVARSGIVRRISEAGMARDRGKGALQLKVLDAGVARDTAKADLQVKIDRANKIISGAAPIREAVEREPHLVKTISVDKLELAQLLNQADDLRVKSSAADSEYSGLIAEVRSLEQLISRLDGLDCHGDSSSWLNPNCRFIADAVAAKKSLPAKQARCSELTTLRISLCDELEPMRETVQLIQEAINDTEKLLVECQRYTKLVPELDLAEGNLVAWQADLVDLDIKHDANVLSLGQEIEALVQKHDADVLAWQQEIESLVQKAEADLQSLGGDKWMAESEWVLARNQLNERIAALGADIKAFPPSAYSDLDATLRTLAIRESAALASIEGFEKRIREAELAVASLQTRLEACADKLAEAGALRAKEGRYAAEINKFSLLMKACSNDGIIQLELEDSGPSISAIVNDLLSACYGSRFSVRIETQVAKVNGDLKETFDILVFDNEIGDERSITECSGGQVTTIEDAITRAICIYNIHRSDRIYGTLYSDEKDGALDEVRKLEFMKVKREALRIGTHTRELFISQSSDIYAMADARIELSRGGIVIS